MKTIRREALQEKLDEESGNDSLPLADNPDGDDLLAQLRQVKPKKKQRWSVEKKKEVKKKKEEEALAEVPNNSVNATIELIDSDDDEPAPKIPDPTTEEVNSDEDFPADTFDRTPSMSSLSSLDGDRAISCDELSDSEAPSGGKEVPDRFYNISFFVQTHNMFTSIAGMETQKCLMVIKDDHGFKINDFDGKKCKITINPDYAGSEKTFPSGKKMRSYLVQELETEVWLTKDPKSSAMLPLVDVEITNSTSTGIHYPKGVALAVCNFIKTESKNKNSASDPLAQIPDPVASVSQLSMPEPVTSVQSLGIPESVTSADLDKPRKVTKETSKKDIGDKRDSKLVMRCYPSKSFHVNPAASFKTILVVEEDKNDPRTCMENLLQKQCVVKKNDKDSLRCEEFELSLNNSRIHKYTSPSGNDYPAVTVKVKNPGKFKACFDRYDPLALCSLKLSPLTVSITNDMFGGHLPVPVPALTSADDHEDFTTIDSWSASELPEPVPIIRPESPPLLLPTVEDLRGWPVKKLKMCLGDAGLHQYGLKNDLVTRLLDYYKKNPSKVPKPPLSSRDVAKEILNDVIFDVLRTVDMTSRISPEKRFVVANGLGGNVSLSSSGGVYSMNGKRIPVLGNNRQTQADKPAIPIDPRVAENEKILKKVGEIKSFEKLDLDFFKSGMSIICYEDISLCPREKKIVTFKLPELDLFSSELAGRRILIKERDNDRDILTVHKQISNIVINERKSQVEVLVENSFDRQVVVKASEKIKLIRIYVERTPKDLDHQFDIPEDDDVIDAVEGILEKDAFDAATTNDIVLMPKTYHTEVCIIKLNRTLGYQSVALMERTKASSMQIGMRKMIIIPKVLYFLDPSSECQDITIKVKMYNASKQTLRITKKTKIAQVRLQKSADVFSEKEHRLEPDQRMKYGEVRDLEGRVLREGQPVLCSYAYEGVTKPSIVCLVNRNGRLCVPLGSDQHGKYSFFSRLDAKTLIFFRSKEKLHCEILAGRLKLD